MVTLHIPTDLHTHDVSKQVLINSGVTDNIIVTATGEPKQDGISFYQIDYILNYFDDFLDREIERDPDVIYNEYFQEFMQWVVEYKRIVLESRAAGEPWLAVPPIQSGKTVPEVFGCYTIADSHTGIHNWSMAIQNRLKDLVGDGTIDPKIYYTPTQLIAMGGLGGHLDGAIEGYMGACHTDGIKNLFFNIIAPTIQSYDAYKTNLTTDASASPATVAFRNRIDFALSEINDYISNGDYATRTSIMQINFKETADLIDGAIAIDRTKLNIIEHYADVEGAYVDRLDFKGTDVAPQALVIPKDTDDLVSRSEITADLNKAISSYSDPTGSNVIASTYSLAPAQGRIVNVSALTKSLLGSLGSKGNITNPKQSLLNLMQTKIYKNVQGQKKAEYLSAAKQMTLTNELRAAQDKYIALIETDGKVVASGDTGYSRMYRYTQAYPEKAIKVGGSDSKRAAKTAKPPSYYDYYMRTSPSVSHSQAGGAEINVDDLTAANQDTQINITELEKTISTIDLNYKQRKAEYFDSAGVNLANLEQKNDYLVSMMNTMILHMFVVKDRVDRSSTFLTKLKGMSRRIDTVLRDMWDEEMSKLRPAVNPGLLLKYTSGASSTVSEINELFASIGLDPSYAIPSSFDPVINVPGPHNLLSAYAQEYGAGNIGLIARSLRNVFKASKPIFKTGLSTAQLQKRLTTYSNSLKTLTSALEAQYANTEATFADMAIDRDLIGNTIESNLDAANSFITEMLAVLEDFSTKTDQLVEIRQALSKTKGRFTDFETYVKESRAKLEALDGKLGPNHDALLADVGLSIKNHDMPAPTVLYQQATDGFIIPLTNASGHAIKYFSYDAEAKRLMNLRKIYLETKLRFSVAASMVYSNWNAYLDDTAAVTPTERLLTMLKAAQDPARTYSFLNAYYSSWIPYFPDQVLKLDISPPIMTLIDRYTAPDPNQLKAISQHVLDFDTNNNTITRTADSLNTQSMHEIAGHLVEGAKAYVEFVRKYPDAGAQVHTTDGDNYDQILSEITRLNDTALSQSDDASLANLLVYLNGLQTAHDNAKVRAAFATYLLQVQTDLGLSDQEEMLRYRELIDRSIASVLTLFNTQNQERFQMFASLTLINNSGNPNLPDIQRAQRDSVKQTRSMELISSFPSYRSSTNLPYQIIPRPATPAGPATGGHHYYYPLNRYSVPIINKINTWSDTNPQTYLLLSANTVNSSDLEQIYSDYDQAYGIMEPLIRLMGHMVESGEVIRNGGANVIETRFYLTRGIPTRFSAPIALTAPTTIIDPQRYFTAPQDNTLIASNAGYPIDTCGLKLPNPVTDTMSISGGAITYTSNNILNHVVNLTEIGAMIDIGSSVTVANLKNVLQVLQTGEQVVYFQRQLFGPLNALASLEFEEVATWDQATDLLTSIYSKRLAKKSTIQEALRILQEIESTILDPSSGLQFESTIMVGSNTTPTLLTSSLAAVSAANPAAADFNETADKYWAFTQRYMLNWYAIFGHMLTNLILSDTISGISGVIRLLTAKFNSLTLNGYVPQNADAIRMADLTTIEIQKKAADLGKKLGAHPNSIDTGPNSIAPAVTDGLAYDLYHSNIGSPSIDVYCIIALIKSTSSDIRTALEAVQETTNKMVRAVPQMDSTLEPEYIEKLMERTQPGGVTLASYQTAVRNFIADVGAHLSTALDAAGIDKDDIGVNYLNEYQATISALIEKMITTKPTVAPDPTIVADDAFYMQPDGTNFGRNFIVNFPKDLQTHYEQLYLRLSTKDATLAYFDLQRLILGQLYVGAFKHLRVAMARWFNTIRNQLASTQVQNLGEFQEAFRSYLRSRTSGRTFRISAPTYATTPVPTNTAANQIRFILFDRKQYDANIEPITDLHLTLSRIADYARPSMASLYRSETTSYQRLLNLDYQTRSSLTTQKTEIQQRARSLHLVLQTIDLVMFNEYYTKFAFVNNTTLLEYMNQTVNNYERAVSMVKTKLLDMTSKNNTHVMAVSQINNYIAFSSAIDKLINNEAIVKKFYKRMSFGLAEYYLDVLQDVIRRIDNKPIETMTEIESYLYRYHYIQLHRCYALFRWIRHDFLPDQQREDELKRKSNTPFIPILKYKIEPLKTQGDVNRVFVEFQGLRSYLDDYSAVEMDKVQLHLRINDFAHGGYNRGLEALEREDPTKRSTAFMMDYAPDSDDYSKMWDTGRLLFTNPNNSNMLRVNFEMLDQIYHYDNPGQTRPFDLYYNDVYRKMENKNTGIKFKRIYNTQVYPDSDVISNYMSIAPNILNGKGTVIMTYGYSGTGKSASLFGRPADPSLGALSPSNGILQATLTQFPNVEIYFRVYEIYGLGVPYNYYWNPQTANQPDCYPRFSQAVIHHVVDASNPDTLTSVDQLVFTNRHDILAYVMDFSDPARTTPGFAVQDADKENMGGKRTYGHYFDASDQMKASTYVQINKNHYNNFDAFVDSVDKARKKGVTIRYLLSHLAQQIKGTINNRESSRSILVYDFEIRDMSVPNPIFVPFVIYDLPGKEDIYRTYITTNETTKTSPEDKANAFKDIPGDLSRERKSTYATNPLLIPIFDDNADVMMRILTQLSNASPGPGYDGTGTLAKFDPAYETRIVDEIISYRVTNFAFKNAGGTVGYAYEDNHAEYNIGELFVNNGLDIHSFVALYNPANYNSSVRVANSQNELAVFRGITGAYPSQSNAAAVIDKELRIVIGVVVIAFLIKYRLFDVVVEIINVIMNPPDGSDIGADGGWSRSKIYAFYEAYYINENVVGLLQYLITEILGKSSTIKEQYSAQDTISDTINRNWKTANRYRVARNQYIKTPTGKINLNYGMYVNEALLATDPNDPLNKQDIEDFKSANNVEPNGMFADMNTLTSDVIKRIANVIAFENKGKYNSNDIFRSGNIECSGTDANRYIINPQNAVSVSAPKLLIEHNSPLLQDFIEPYEQKISFYYVFYVVSNSQAQTKAEEQVKLLNNSMPFINEMDS